MARRVRALRMQRSVVLAAVAAAASATDIGVFRDQPWVGDDSDASLQYLDSDGGGCVWSASNGSLRIPAHVPGELLTDLFTAGVIPDPWYELTWLQYVNVWEGANWTYTCSGFAASPEVLSALQNGGDALLVFDSVKMAAYASLNGVYLGVMNDQFLRWNFSVGGVLRSSNNTLSVTFTPSSDPANDEGRVMGCSGGWDWGPLTNTRTPTNTRTLTKGIVKSAYLVPVSGVGITHVVPLITYGGGYPTAPLTDAAAGPWTVNVTVHLFAVRAVTGMLNVSVGPWAAGVHVSVPAAGQTAVTLGLDVPVGAVSLWWPAGLGSQTLYELAVAFTPSSGLPGTFASRDVGFRVFYLVTADDSDSARIAGVDGSGNFTMRFKVNGADVFSRGADIIPMEALEARQTSVAYTMLMDSAVAAGFNTIRVDGIDTYAGDVFYNLADRLGIMIYHDIQYSQGQPAPQATPLQDAELRHQIRRLSAHPSIVVYDGCNECGGQGVYASFVMTVVVEEDPSRIPWPSSPSAGWISGVDQLTGLPNGNTLNPRPYVSAAQPSSRTTSSACVFQENTDYCNTCFDEPHPAAQSPQDCCAACAANASCWTAVFDPSSGECWFKPVNATPVYKAGVTACWPGGNGPIPPAPAPTPSGVIETHGPYQHGTGFPAVNGANNLQPFDPLVPPEVVALAAVGTSVPGTYASEFGCVAMSSFESMTTYLAPAHWGLHGGAPPDVCTGGFFQKCVGDNVMAQRNYPCDSIVAQYFGNAVLPSLNDTGVAAFQRQLYGCMMGQALRLKGDIEARRSYNTWGLLTWQLNEIWPTGGWGSVEYGYNATGQVIGGRWKPLHHWYAQHLLQDVIVSCGAAGLCYVKNDSPLLALNGIVTLSLVHINANSIVQFATVSVTLGQGAGVTAWFCMSGASPAENCPSVAAVLSSYGCFPTGSDCVLLLQVTNGTGTVVAANWEIFAVPAALALPSASVTAQVQPRPAPDGTATVTVSCDNVALFVTLTSRAQGRFSENAFILHPATNGSSITRTVSFMPFGPLDIPTLTATLRIEHVAMYFPAGL